MIKKIILAIAAVYLFFSLRAAVLYFVEYEDCTQFSATATPGVLGGPSEAVMCRDMNEVRLKRIFFPLTPAPLYL
jgi:hypothetical protein